jgi:hypothetical protein
MMMIMMMMMMTIMIIIIIITIIIITCLTSVLTNLETTFRLTLGCHGGSPSPFEIYETCKSFALVIYLYLTLCKYLPKFPT